MTLGSCGANSADPLQLRDGWRTNKGSELVSLCGVMVAYCLIPIVLQGVLMVVDEGWFHRARGLPRWERIGHPLDTLTIAVCLAWLVGTAPRSSAALSVYVGLAVFSTLFVTKDEAVHAGLCSPGEHLLHAVLLVLHPIVLAAFIYLWWTGAVGLLVGQLGLTIAFLAYQVIYWNLERAEAESPESPESPESDAGAWSPGLGFVVGARDQRKASR